MMRWPDLIPELPPDARTHAMTLLETAEGDWQTAREVVCAYKGEYSDDYLMRLEWLLTPKGEA